ncbi:MAG TPA: SRPBCC family protein [Terriglobia bacterium]|nr:SRPBCC family protein [Terriglobia bacterium]
MTNEYHFVTRWQFDGQIEEVYDLIRDALNYPRWWPSVYLETQEIAPGDESGVGRRIRLHTKGWLPYTLRWESCATEVKRPHLLTVRATGDFDGRGIWTLEQQHGPVNVTFDWKLTADKPLLRNLSFLLKPAFSANHRWAMARGEESLRLELARRQAATSEEASRVPAPPGPNRTSGLWLTLAAVAVIGILAGLFRLAWP